MAGEKRSASQRGDGASPAKKSKPARGFPSFEDGDVSINLGNSELKLHRQTLRDNCKYFADCKFPVFRFGVRPRIFEQQILDSQTFLVRPLLSDAGFPVSDDLIKRAYAANEAVFRLLYRQPLACATPADFRDAAALTVAYGCVESIKNALTTAILRASLGTTLFRDDPWALLKAAHHLKDESIFSEALVHVAGRGGNSSNDKGEEVSSAVAALIDSHVTELEAKIIKCWRAVMSRPTQSGINGALADSALRCYLDKHISCTLGSPTRPEVYRALISLHRMEDVDPLVQATVLSQVDDVFDSLCAGIEAMELFGATMYESDEDLHSITESRMDKGLKRNLSRPNVLNAMKTKLERVKRGVNPLFVGDRNAGYFTCIQFKGPFPWKSSTAESE